MAHKFGDSLVQGINMFGNIYEVRPIRFFTFAWTKVIGRNRIKLLMLCFPKAARYYNSGDVDSSDLNGECATNSYVCDIANRMISRSYAPTVSC